jgi:hypothetical protein
MAVAIGFENKASGNGAVAIGDPNVATGHGAVAIGADNIATGTGAIALGNMSSAIGSSAVAIGDQANATGSGAIALGAGATSQGQNSVAIGTGSFASRVNQISLGSTDSTYTMAGLASPTSQAAQVGETRFISTDAAGNLAASNVGPNAIMTLQARTGTLEGQVTQLQNGLRRADAGTAIALAMGGTMMPPDMRVAMSFNLATYNGQRGFSASVVARASRHVYFNAGAATGTVRGSTGGRAGVTIGW